MDLLNSASMETTMHHLYLYVQDFEEVKLGDDEYLVMGDNRPYSKDSRYVGPVKKSQLFAKKMLVLLPISDIGVKD